VASLQIRILDHPELLRKLEAIDWTPGVVFEFGFYTGRFEAIIDQVYNFVSLGLLVHLLSIHHRYQVNGAIKSFIRFRRRYWLQPKVKRLYASHEQKAARDMSWELDPIESGLNWGIPRLSLNHTRIAIDSLSNLPHFVDVLSW
jgi:hypothetical protein